MGPVEFSVYDDVPARIDNNFYDVAAIDSFSMEVWSDSDDVWCRVRDTANNAIVLPNTRIPNFDKKPRILAYNNLFFVYAQTAADALIKISFDPATLTFGTATTIVGAGNAVSFDVHVWSTAETEAVLIYSDGAAAHSLTKLNASGGIGATTALVNEGIAVRWNKATDTVYVLSSPANGTIHSITFSTLAAVTSISTVFDSTWNGALGGYNYTEQVDIEITPGNDVVACIGGVAVKSFTATEGDWPHEFFASQWVLVEGDLSALASDRQYLPHVVLASKFFRPRDAAGDFVVRTGPTAIFQIISRTPRAADSATTSANAWCRHDNDESRQ
jgi:hypothetical protein